MPPKQYLGVKFGHSRKSRTGAYFLVDPDGLRDSESYITAERAAEVFSEISRFAISPDDLRNLEYDQVLEFPQTRS
jgi:hypothetical protein